MDSRVQFLVLCKRKRTITSLVRLNKLASEVFAIFMHIQRGGGEGGETVQASTSNRTREERFLCLFI